VKFGPTSVALQALFALAIVAVAPVEAASSSQTNAEIALAYSAVLNAEQSGGNVTALVAQLNSAILLVHQANQINVTNPTQAQSLYSQASTVASRVIQAAPVIASAGRASVGAAQIELGIETTVLAALAVLAYVYTPGVFWSLWLRTHRNWKVKKS
jgi:hypothetical protein